MATGDQNDVQQRLQTALPNWFGDNAPVLNALLSGFAYAGSFIYSQYSYIVQQSRLLTATDIWLDAFALDFFGLTIQRKQGQSDDSFRQTIEANLFRNRCTRAAIISVLEDVTGRTPLVFEPMRAMDTGGYEVMMAYDLQGGYGAMNMPYQALVTAYLPASTGIPDVSGYDGSSFAYDTPAQGEYGDLSMVETSVGDDDIYAAIQAVKPIGTAIWVQILPNPISPPAFLGDNFVLDQSQLGATQEDTLDNSFVLDESTLQAPPAAALDQNFTLDTSELS